MSQTQDTHPAPAPKVVPIYPGIKPDAPEDADPLTHREAIEMLSFVRSRSKKGSGRDWWVVPDMPNYSMECILGEALGREFLAYSRRYEREFEMIPSTFAAVVADMVKLGKFTGTELMFVRVVAHAAIGGGR